MDVADAKERMLEVENLTDALEDDDANWLLDWGAKQVGPLIQGIADDDQAGEKVNQLMGVMRSINRITGDRNAAPPDELTDDVHQLVDKYNAAFSTSISPSDEQIKALVGRIATLNERDTMQALLAAVMPTGTTTSAAQPASAPQAAPASAPAAGEVQPAGPPADATSAGGKTVPPSSKPPQQATPQAPQQPEAAKQNEKQPGTPGQEESHA